MVRYEYNKMLNWLDNECIVSSSNQRAWVRILPDDDSEYPEELKRYVEDFRENNKTSLWIAGPKHVYVQLIDVPKVKRRKFIDEHNKR